MPKIPYTKNQESILTLEPNLKGESFLSVGFNEIIPGTGISAKAWFYYMFKDLGFTKFEILEIFKTNCHFARNYFKAFNPSVEVTHGDVKNCLEIYGEDRFDASMHWHGIEHLDMNNIPSTLEGLEKITKKFVILGFPNGHLHQGPVYGNSHEEHKSDPTAEYIQQFGYDTTVVTWNRMQHVTAIKKLC